MRVYNLCARGTAEDRVLDVLDRRIHLFELVVGEMDMVLGNLADERDLEERILSIYAESREEDEVARAFDAIAEELARARGQYERTRALARRGALLEAEEGSEVLALLPPELSRELGLSEEVRLSAVGDGDAVEAKVRHLLAERFTLRVHTRLAAALWVAAPVARVRRRKGSCELVLRLPAGAHGFDLLPCEGCPGITERPALCDERLHVLCEMCVPLASGRPRCPACDT